MALRHQMTSSGRWLFSWRSYLPLALVALLAFRIAGRPVGEAAPWRLWWTFGSLAVSCLGLLARALVAGHVPAGTSGRTTSQPRAAVLNTTGMYSIVRHPLYLGNFLLWLGIALASRDGWFVLTFILSFWLYYERIMLAEEAYLADEFGPAFERWATTTPAFLPRFRLWRRPELGFSLRNVLRREYTALLGIVGAFAGLEFAQSLTLDQRPVVPWPWVAALGCAAVVYFVLRHLKRHTSLLRAKGR